MKSGATLAGTGVLGQTTVEPGGHLAPGDSPGTITVGGLTLQNGAFFDFEIGPTATDRVDVNGDLTLGGTLVLSLLDGYIPSLGQSFAIFGGAISSISGTFQSIVAPTFDGQTVYLAYGTGQVMLQVGEANFPGDFNHDGRVDAADYVVWRKTGINGQQGYDTWRSNFGATIGSSVSTSAAVPEPATIALLYLATLTIVSLRAVDRTSVVRRAIPREH